jgi:hypothetical protein
MRDGEAVRSEMKTRGNEYRAKTYPLLREEY